jgi:hypothetical protein
VQKASRKQNLKGAAGIEASSPSAGIGALAQYSCSEVTRHHDGLTHRGLLHLHATSSCQSWLRHMSAASASSHGSLTACVDACRWRAQQLLGAPDTSLPREGVFAGQAPGGYCCCSGYRVSRSTCSWATSTAQL